MLDRQRPASARRHDRAVSDVDDWRARAACRGRDTKWWYPESGDFRIETEIAVSVCRSCPVSVECLAAALDEERSAYVRFGIRGGLLPGQRASRRRLVLAS